MMAKHLVGFWTRLRWWFKFFPERTAQNYLFRKAVREVQGPVTSVRTAITDDGIEWFYGARRTDDDG